MKIKEIPDNIVLDKQPARILKPKNKMQLCDRIRKAICELSANPWNGKKLTTGHNIDIWSWRVGRYRIIYQIDRPSPKKIWVIMIGMRETVYKYVASIEKIRFEVKNIE